MSTRADLAACEDRDENGMPKLRRPITRPIARVRSGRAPVTSNVEQHVDNSVDKSVNKPMPWVALASLFGGLGFGAALVLAITMQGRIESEGRAVRAEVRTDFQQQIADMDARLKVAEYEASIAKNTAQKVEVRMNNKESSNARR